MMDMMDMMGMMGMIDMKDMMMDMMCGMADVRVETGMDGIPHTSGGQLGQTATRNGQGRQRRRRAGDGREAHRPDMVAVHTILPPGQRVLCVRTESVGGSSVGRHVGRNDDIA